jgi:hypothetical protein
MMELMPARRNRTITKEERQERWERCADFLRRAGNIPAARKLAAQEGFGANTSVWISALSKILEGKV